MSATHDFKCSSIRELLRGAMTDQINDREIFMKGYVGVDWNEGVPASVVHCTDGDVKI